MTRIEMDYMEAVTKLPRLLKDILNEIKEVKELLKNEKGGEDEQG